MFRVRVVFGFRGLEGGEKKVSVLRSLIGSFLKLGMPFLGVPIIRGTLNLRP